MVQKHTYYTVPLSVEEATRREVELAIRISEVDEQLKDRPKRESDPDWARRAMLSRSRMQRDIELIRAWINENKPSHQLEAKVAKQASVDLFWSAYRLLDSLRKRGATFDPTELDLMKRLGEFFGLSKDNALKAARSCCQGSIEEIARCGPMIVEATHDPKDLEVLHRNWLCAQKTIRSSGGRSESLLQAAFALVKGHLAMNQITEAVEVARSMHAKDSNVIWAWAHIYDQTKDPAYLKVVREIASTMDVETEAYALCVVFQKSGALADLRKAQKALERCGAEHASDAKVSRQKSVLFGAYLAWDLFNEAHALLPAITNQKARLLNLCHLAETQPTAANLQLVLQEIASSPLKRPVSLLAVIDACTALGQFATARTIIEACDNSSGLQCMGFACLANKQQNPEKNEDLQKAERLSVTMGSQEYTTRSAAQIQLVRAFVLAGRIDEAAQLAAVISHIPLRCEACVMVYAASK